MTKSLLLFATAIPLVSLAQEPTSYVCKIGDLTRRVEIVYETGVTVPCEVQYFKDSESPGQMQVLWRALNEEGYCEARTREFVTKLKGMGWDCGADGDQDASTPESAAPVGAANEDKGVDDGDDDDMDGVPDDTDTLAPAGDIEIPAGDSAH